MINEAAWEITQHHTDFTRTFGTENELLRGWWPVLELEEKVAETQVNYLANPIYMVMFGVIGRTNIKVILKLKERLKRSKHTSQPFSTLPCLRYGFLFSLKCWRLTGLTHSKEGFYH